MNRERRQEERLSLAARLQGHAARCREAQREEPAREFEDLARLVLLTCGALAPASIK